MNVKQMLFKGMILGAATACVPALSYGQVLSIGIGISIHTPPPPLPVYVQPACPTPGYLWTPGYWGYAGAGYYWVPGVWVAPPQPGLLWTPGYWGFAGGLYGWHAGYWGPHVGFYGGVNYGFGYGGVGFFGGVWAGGVFRYNTAYSNVNTTVIHNTYINRTVVNNTTVINHASFNGPGGVSARPTPEQMQYSREQHFNATPNQMSHQQTASMNRAQFASANGGHPQDVAMNRVNGRRFNQQGRIANGVGSGQLNAGETRNLENREANLNNTIHNQRSANGGTLTPQERAQDNQRQNNLSNSIYNDKHNANTAHYGNNEVGDRRYEQQQRLSQGIRSGQITDRGAANSEQREQNINRSDFQDRRADGGRLTGQERQNLNRRQNGASQQIYRQRHNDAHAPR